MARVPKFDCRIKDTFFRTIGRSSCAILLLYREEEDVPLDVSWAENPLARRLGVLFVSGRRGDRRHNPLHENLCHTPLSLVRGGICAPFCSVTLDRTHPDATL